MDEVRRISLYATAVIDGLQDEVAYVDGSAWERWITDLTGFCERAGLPIGAGRELRASGEASEFVALVDALTAKMEPHLRRHAATIAALAKAIGEARRKAEERKKARDTSTT
jgi:hypothetical protein